MRLRLHHSFVLTSLIKLGLAPSADAQLIDAAKLADWDAVATLVDQGAAVDDPALDGATALHWASYWDDLPSAEFLIRAGADPSAANDLGATPLWNATVNGSTEMARLLLEAGADPNAALTMGETVVMTAARSGAVHIVRRLLAAGANPDSRAARGQTALMWAAAHGHSGVVKVLADHGADLTLRTDVWSELRKTDPAQESHPDHQVWIEQGGNTALMFAVRSGDLASVQALVAAGSDVNTEAAYGISATTLAAHSDHAEIVEFLLESGADPHAIGGGYNALHAAILRGNERGVRALLSHGADPNAPLLAPSPVRRQSRDYFFHRIFVGASPFWLAARFTQPEIMKALADFGADPHFVHEVGYWTGLRPAWTWENEGGTTALMAATGLGGRVNRGYVTAGPLEREARVLEAVRVAADLGIDLDARNARGMSALDAAMARGYDSVAEFLSGRGAVSQP